MSKKPEVYINHIGYLCHSSKKVIVKNSKDPVFEIQDMSKVKKEALGTYENWETVFSGKLVKQKTAMGSFRTGDFSKLQKPGFTGWYLRTFPPLATSSSYPMELIIP
jgi:hypothetical protein